MKNHPGETLEAYSLHSMDTDVDDSVTFYKEYKNVIHYIYIKREHLKFKSKLCSIRLHRNYVQKIIT